MDRTNWLGGRHKIAPRRFINHWVSHDYESLLLLFHMNNRLVTTTVTAPLDTIKTNMYAAGRYGVTELTHKIVHKEGFRGLLRGWSAAYVRLGKS